MRNKGSLRHRLWFGLVSVSVSDASSMRHGSGSFTEILQEPTLREHV
jgi:hypothetical protein